MLTSMQPRRSLSSGRGDGNGARIRRRLFRWSIAEKGSTGDTPKPPISPPPPVRPPPPKLRSDQPTPPGSLDHVRQRRLESVTPQGSRKPPATRKASESSVKAPSMRVLSRFRLSIRASTPSDRPQKPPPPPPPPPQTRLSVASTDYSR